MTDLEWLLMAADRARELPDPHLDWKWARLGDSVIFAVSDHPPHMGGKNGPVVAVEIVDAGPAKLSNGRVISVAVGK